MKGRAVIEFFAILVIGCGSVVVGYWLYRKRYRPVDLTPEQQANEGRKLEKGFATAIVLLAVVIGYVTFRPLTMGEIESQTLTTVNRDFWHWSAKSVKLVALGGNRYAGDLLVDGIEHKIDVVCDGRSLLWEIK